MDILNPRYSIYVLSLILIASLVLFNSALLFDNTPKVEEYRGVYFRGFENSTFVPCSGEERWWAEGKDVEPGTNLPLRYDSLVTESEQPIYLVVLGVLFEKGGHGHAGGWDRTLGYKRIVASSVQLPADCQPQLR